MAGDAEEGGADEEEEEEEESAIESVAVADVEVVAGLVSFSAIDAAVLLVADVAVDPASAVAFFFASRSTKKTNVLMYYRNDMYYIIITV